MLIYSIRMRRRNPLVWSKIFLEKREDAFSDPLQSPGDMAFNGLGRDGELLADVLMRKVAQPAQFKDLPALGGQLFYGRKDVLELFFVDDRFFCPGARYKSIGELLCTAERFFT